MPLNVFQQVMSSHVGDDTEIASVYKKRLGVTGSVSENDPVTSLLLFIIWQERGSGERG